MILSGDLNEGQLANMRLSPCSRRVYARFASWKPGGASEAIELCQHEGKVTLRVSRRTQGGEKREERELPAGVGLAVLARIATLRKIPSVASNPNARDGAGKALLVETRGPNGTRLVHDLSWHHAPTVPTAISATFDALGELAAAHAKEVQLQHFAH